ncbi:MAG: S8 family serine peptidase [Nitrospirota bacterium]|nr:S8 family serine peptidase [Nitrospirota bacterium]MDP2383247.1 S8 family serine peptidase [Nitrospirota bacterium]MDP3599384.1 S8 family serine peptidase [Nitrospirota bacterium]
MLAYRYGGSQGQQYKLELGEAYVAVRTRSRRSLDASLESKKGREVLAELEQVARFHDAGVEVFRYGTNCRTARAKGVVRTLLNNQRDVQFAGRVLIDPRSKRPVLYTENVFVQFDADMAESACRRTLKEYRLEMKRPIEYVRNGFFVQAVEGTGRTVFDITDRLLRHKHVDLCHPELVRKTGWRQVFPQQWHLKKTTIGGTVYDAHANVEAAWALSRGEGIRIAVIDDGCDIDHEELAGSGKIVAPRDVTRRTDDPRPGSRDNHGTACSGVACANGHHGASGVAPDAQLMPIRYASPLGSQAEADAFVWAASHGADVISCSWGPEDGDWWDPNDPAHRQMVPLPDSTRVAIDWAIANGRNGKGCVITFAAGNGNESVDNDGYASYEKVIAVAACHAKNKRSAYSDFGNAVWCTFPSNDTVLPVPGIWTTDRSGTAGYNPGQVSRGDAVGNYVNDFGGTSSACPGVAGVAALVLSRNPSLRWDEVKDILKRSCDPIDAAGGNYNAQGHSPFYGYGKVNAKRAVELAAPVVAIPTSMHTATRLVPIRDLKTSTISVTIGETAVMSAVTVSIDIEHTYVGDLVIKLAPPSSTRVGAILLHNRQGGGSDNLKTTYDIANTPALAALAGKKPQGRWRLTVADKARADEGRILQFSVLLSL